MKNGESALLKRFFRLAALVERPLPPCHPRIFGNSVFAVIAFEDDSKSLFVAAQTRKSFPDGLDGEMRSSQDGFLLLAPLSSQNAAVLQAVFPWTAPQSMAQQPVLWMAETFAGLAELHRPGIVNLPEEVAVDEFVDQLTFQALEAGYDDGFSLQLEAVPEQELLSPFGSSHLFQLGKVAGEVGELAADYRRKRYLLDEHTVLAFDDTLLGECQVRYQAVLARLNRLARALEKVRKHDFELLLQLLDVSDDELTAHLLYLARELRRRKVRNVVFQLPHPIRREWLLALRYGCCAVTSCHDGIRENIELDNQTKPLV